MSLSPVPQRLPDEIYLSVIVPAFDEVDRIGSSVARMLAFLDSRPYSFELIVVLDGGRDGAAAAIARVAGNRPEVIVLDNGVNRGKGFSVRRGVAQSRGARVLFVDADLSLPIEDVDRFLAALDAGSDVAIGSRALAGSAETGSEQRLRRRLGRVFNWFVRSVALPGLGDTQCGFKMFRGPEARALFRTQRIDRFGFDVEVLRIARRRAFRIVEVPVRCEYRPGSSVHKLRDGTSMIVDVLGMLWRDWRGGYDDRR